jgi:nitrile hydratase
MQGFGEVDRGPEPPLERWEATVIALQAAGMAAAGSNIDAFRHAIERMDAGHYLGSTYYEHWLDGLLRLLDEAGVVPADDYAERLDLLQQDPEAAIAVAGSARESRRRDSHRFVREVAAPARFAGGDAVVTQKFQPEGHTRLPRYARGRRGVIAAVHDAMVFPDSHAHELGERPQYVYSVRFEVRELWGEAADEGAAVYLDLWESYLLPGAA